MAAIVEGEGEVAAVPILLRRLAAWRSADVDIEVVTPIKVKRQRFLNRDEEFHRYVTLAAGKCSDDGWILILLDADDDCPAAIGQRIAARAARTAPHRRVSVVMANREYEAWFIAAAASLSGQRGFVFDTGDSISAESPRDAKGWIRSRMESGQYGETTDQPAFSSRMSLEQAFKGSRSFRKLCTEWDKQCNVA